MGYEINVSLNGKHFFATHEHSLTHESDLKKCLDVFVEKFPESEGYKITVSHWQKIGRHIDIEEVLK